MSGRTLDLVLWGLHEGANPTQISETIKGICDTSRDMAKSKRTDLLLREERERR